MMVIASKPPVRDQKYRAFVRSLPCSVPDCGHRRIEAAHTSALGLRGMSQKSSDRSCIPLCSAHHREFHSIGEKRFEKRYDLDVRAIVDELNIRPMIRVHAGRFIGFVQGREYTLGLVGIGVKQALRHMVQFRVEELRARE